MAEAMKVRQGYKDCDFALKGPKVLSNDNQDDHPNNWDFPRIIEWLKLRLQKMVKKSSLLFLSFTCHGVKGHVCDTLPVLMKIEQLLKIMNASPELEEIPKVCKKVYVLQIFVAQKVVGMVFSQMAKYIIIPNHCLFFD